MKLNTLMFGVLIIGIIFTGMGYIIGDFGTSFPTVGANLTGFNNMSTSFTQIANISSNASATVQNPVGTFDGISQALGIYKPATDAIMLFSNMVNIFGGVANTLQQTAGFFIPSWLLYFVGIAFLLVFILGILKYIFKVD